MSDDTRRSTGSSRPDRRRCAATPTGCWSATTRSAPSGAAAAAPRSAGSCRPTCRPSTTTRARRRGHRASAAAAASRPSSGCGRPTAGGSPPPMSRSGAGGGHPDLARRRRPPGLADRQRPARRRERRRQGPVRRAGSADRRRQPGLAADARVEPVHARAVELPLEAGASVRGIARTDEFAYSLAGTNVHYGTPPNPQAPLRISGGSTSGSTSAVSLGPRDHRARHRHRRLDPGAGVVPGPLRHPHHERLSRRRTHCSRCRAPSTRSAGSPAAPESPAGRSARPCCRRVRAARRASWSASRASPRSPATRWGLVVDRYAAEHGAMRESWDL